MRDAIKERYSLFVKGYLTAGAGKRRGVSAGSREQAWLFRRPSPIPSQNGSYSRAGSWRNTVRSDQSLTLKLHQVFLSSWSTCFGVAGAQRGPFH